MKSTIRGSSVLAFCCAGAAISAGCSELRQPSAQRKSPDPPRSSTSVYIDPLSNGAARNAAPSAAAIALSAESRPQLDFVVQGTGRSPQSGGEQDRKLAMSQAAIVEALANAVIELRRRSGESTNDFSIDLGSRVTLDCRAIPDGEREIELRAVDRGSPTLLHSKAGVLQNAPYDLATIRRIFDSTHGRFALLSTEQDQDGSETIAAVGCYRLMQTATANRHAAGAAVNRIPSTAEPATASP